MDIKAKKSLGQNFLNDEEVLLKIANSIKTNADDLIIEIGPGKGALTKYLNNKDSYLVCYEIDTRMKDILKKYESDKTKIIYEDILKADINNDLNDISYNDLYIIANIPYYITTPIIKKVIGLSKLKSMSLLVQKEVAERFVAKPNSRAYGSLTVYLNYYFDIEYLFDVKNTCFVPAPKVDSAVVKFIRKDNTGKVKNEKVFFKLIQDSFKMKRKTLKNNLRGYDWKKLKSILGDYNLGENVRAEQISLEVYMAIANLL